MLTNATNVTPPAWLRAVLTACLPDEDRASLAAELDALFAQRVRGKGRGAAVIWYTRQALGFVLHVGLARILDGLGGTSGVRGDARLALRAFRRRPSFALTFAATLAIGIGVLATVYTAARWLMLRPVPGVLEPERLAVLQLGSSEAPAHVSWAVSHPDFELLRQRLPLNGALAALTPVEVDLRPDDGEPRRVRGAVVSSSFFSVLGARFAAGRGFLPDEDQRVVGEPALVLSHGLARRLSSAGDAVRAAADAVVAAVRAEFRSHSYIALHQGYRVFPGIGLDPAVRASVRRTLAQLGLVAGFLFLLAMVETGLLAVLGTAVAMGLAWMWGRWYQGV